MAIHKRITHPVKIKDYRIHPIAIADPPLRSSYGLHQPYALRTIIELESEDGIIGISETYGGDGPVHALEKLRSGILGSDVFNVIGSLRPHIKKEPIGLETSQTYLVPGENPLDADQRSYAAIEVACLDLIGKSLGYSMGRG